MEFEVGKVRVWSIMDNKELCDDNQKSIKTLLAVYFLIRQ